MNYFQIIVPTPKTEEKSEILIALMANIGYESFEVNSSNLLAYITETDFVKDELLGIDYCSKSDKLGNLEIKLIPHKNWNEIWESNYPSVIIADRCYIRAAFHPRKPKMDYEIIITPKMAFGTAHHETTAMMLELILENDFTNKKVLDMGCGTGVLAILSSMKGARAITAIDIDNSSYMSTIENAAVNNIADITVIEGGSESLSKTDNFDIIFANINKNILIRDMKSYSNTLTFGGHIYFSGFYNDDLPDIIIEAEKYGLVFDKNLEKNNWVAAVFIRS